MGHELEVRNPAGVSFGPEALLSRVSLGCQEEFLLNGLSKTHAESNKIKICKLLKLLILLKGGRRVSRYSGNKCKWIEQKWTNLPGKGVEGDSLQ
jgi:hypothetical protein